MTYPINFKIQYGWRFILALLLRTASTYAKGGGAGESPGGSGSTYSSSSSSSNTYYSSGWVFWYGNGGCGQYCVVTFAIVGVLLLLVILCGIWRCCLIKRYYKEDKKTRINFDPDMAELGRSDSILGTTPHRTALAQQYPPLRDDPDPPSYDKVSAAPEPSYLHGIRHNASWQAYKEGQKFNRENPPYEISPPADHIEHIITLGGPKAWEIRLEDSIRNNNLVSVSNHGRVIRFNGKYDTMVQTNYPLFRPDDNDSYDETSPTSETGLQPPTDVLQRPPPVYKEGPPRLYESLSEWFYYYEITILSNPRKKHTTIAMGLATKPYPPFRLPGWHRESVGWHSDDGHKFYNSSYGGQPYSERWGDVGDVLGCGYYPNTGIVFFTKNGQRLDNAFSGVRHIWFPAIGADDECEIELNFGGDEKEFRYEEARGTSVAGPIKTSSNVSINSLR